MKKPYERLTLEIEGFSPANSTSSCGYNMTISSGSGCSAPQNDILNDLFILSSELFTNQCDDDLNTMDYEGICYHTPSGNIVVLQS